MEKWLPGIYADDIALYKIIQSPVDSLLVQENINAISEWVLTTTCS